MQFPHLLIPLTHSLNYDVRIIIITSVQIATFTGRHRIIHCTGLVSIKYHKYQWKICPWLISIFIVDINVHTYNNSRPLLRNPGHLILLKVKKKQLEIQIL